MEIVRKYSTDYVKSSTNKDLIVLHYTAGGTLAGAEAALAIKDYINVHYAIDRNGTIYRYFDEKYWAYHTGTGLKDAKRSIGIELICWGHLVRQGDALYTWTNKKIPWEDVVKCAKFRGYEYFHKLTQEQIASLRWLIKDIKTRHPNMHVVTHSSMKTTKLDYPPDYPDIRDLVG